MSKCVGRCVDCFLVKKYIIMKRIKLFVLLVIFGSFSLLSCGSGYANRKKVLNFNGGFDGMILGNKVRAVSLIGGIAASVIGFIWLAAGGGSIMGPCTFISVGLGSIFGSLGFCLFEQEERIEIYLRIALHIGLALSLPVLGAGIVSMNHGINLAPGWISLFIASGVTIGIGTACLLESHMQQ